MYSSLASTSLHRYGKLTCHMGSHSDTCHPIAVSVTHVVQRLGHSCCFCYELYKTTLPENEQTTTKDDFIHIIDYLQKEKKIKQTTFPANTHSPAPTATQLLLLTGPRPAQAQVRKSSRDRDSENLAFTPSRSKYSF